jgi:F0F1-type ATP synthase membrane subunit b/b'
MDNNDVMELLDALFAMISEAWGVPLGNDKCIIEREKALKIVSDIKAALPTSISEAKRLVAARDEFIGNAKREAEAMRKSAEEKARMLVDEQEITRVARSRSAEMIASAETKAAEIRRLAGEYVDTLMRQSEETLSGSLNAIREKRSNFRGLKEARRPAPSNPKEL